MSNSTSTFRVQSNLSSTTESSSSLVTSSSSTFVVPTSSTDTFTSSTPVTSSIFSSSISTSATSTPETSATTSFSATSLATFTSRITVTPSGTNTSPTVVTVTSTASLTPTSSGDLAASSSAAAAASSSSRAAALATSGASTSNSGGLKSGGKIAIAVVVPIVAIALIVAGLIFFWKKRKARESAEEERRREVEEYGYNPNNDPTLPAVGSTYGETHSEMTEDNSGYRGWGATSTQRKPSTTLGSSGRGPVGLAVSDTNSNNGAYNGSPSEGASNDPLVSGGHDAHDAEPVGALGAAPAASGQNRDLDRGPSNASSAYTGHRSEGSNEGDRAVNGGYTPQHYYDDVTHYNDAQPNHGPYGDGTYGGQGQPVIRDVQARRNTRIEKPSVFPQQGNAGIAQNF